MVKDGLIERFGINEVYSMHNSPGLPVGQFGIRPRPFYAATDQFEIDVIGKGGHAVMPSRSNPSSSLSPASAPKATRLT